MPSAAPSRLPLCPAPCDPLSSYSFLWSWVQILSESISYLCGWEGISALAVDAEQEGHCNASRAGNTRGGGLWGTCNQGAALGRSSQFPAGRQGTGPAGRFSQLGDTHPTQKPPHQTHQNELGGCLCPLCPCLLRQPPVHNFFRQEWAIPRPSPPTACCKFMDLLPCQLLRFCQLSIHFLKC